MSVLQVFGRRFLGFSHTVADGRRDGATALLPYSKPFTISRPRGIKMRNSITRVTSFKHTDARDIQKRPRGAESRDASENLKNTPICRLVFPNGAASQALQRLEPGSSQQEFNDLCYCLTLPDLREHPTYASWTPQLGRLLCFESLRGYLGVLFPDQETPSKVSHAPCVVFYCVLSRG